MKLTKSKLREIIREVMTETEAEGYDDPAYRATVKQFKGKNVSKEKFAQALAMHHDSMKNEEALKEGKIKVGDKVKSAIYMHRGDKGKVVDIIVKKINGRDTPVAVVDFGDGKPVDHEIRRLKKI
jgi:uncharacterized protein (UPF0335 family)|tara:strand:- start:1644 stop:2018 length:375 start_codon:yes stop_codon:yes gene_type:complete